MKDNNMNTRSSLRENGLDTVRGQSRNLSGLRVQQLKGGKLNPGIYSNISHADYLKIEAVSNSYLTRLNKCPAAALLPAEDTPSMAFGRALHCYVLDGHETFDSLYAIAPQCDKRTKEGKKIYEEFISRNGGKESISLEDFNFIKAMSLAILSHPFAKKLLEQGLSEQTVIWQDEETGLLCKCRPDRIPDNVKGVFLDLKTCENASPYAFQQSVNGYGYYRQAAMYQEGLGIVKGERYDYFAFIAVEKKPPYRVEVYTLDNQYLQVGYDSFHDLLRQEKKYRESGFYPNYQEAGATELYMPQYLRRVEQ